MESGTAGRCRGLDNGTAYFFAVTASDESGNECEAAAVEATPVEPPDVTAPPVPAGLVAVPGDGSVELSWDAVSGPETGDLAGYTVYRATGAAGPFTEVNDVLESGTSRTVSGLDNETAYYFVVTASDKTGNESEKTATPVEASPVEPPDVTAPPVPAGLVAVPGDGSVELSWDAVSGPETGDLAGYTVYRATGAEGPCTEVNDVLESGTSRTVSGLDNETAYYFVVTASDTTGNESEKTATPVEATPVEPPDVTAPPVPAGLVAVPGDGNVEAVVGCGVGSGDR